MIRLGIDDAQQDKYSGQQGQRRERKQQARVTLEDSEKRLVQYSREREIIDSENRLSTLMARLQEMTTSLVKAEAARIEAEAAYLGLTKADNPGVAGILDSAAIEKLKGRRAELQAEYEQNLEVYKPGYPKMQQIQRQIADIDKTIAKEVAAIAGSIRLKFETRQLEEAKLNQRIAEIKEEVLTLQDRSTDHQTLKREVDTNPELYEGLLQRLKEVGVTAGIGTNNVSVVDPAEVPTGPYKPSLRKNLTIALALGLLLGVGLAYLLETLDDSIKTSEDAERRLGVPVLGLMPMASGDEYGLEGETLALLVKSLEELYKNLGELAAEGHDSVEDIMGNMSSVIRRMTEAEAAASGLMHKPSNELIYWVEVNPRGERLSLNAAPLRVGPLVQKHLWYEKASVIMASATRDNWHGACKI